MVTVSLFLFKVDLVCLEKEKKIVHFNNIVIAGTSKFQKIRIATHHGKLCLEH